MARVKRAVNAHKKRRSTLEAASGYRGQRSRLYRKAKEQLLHSATYQYRDRKDRKGDFRQLWITRINAAARANDMTYNRFIQGLRLAGVEVDRKVLADLAVNDAAAFSRARRGRPRRGGRRGHRRRAAARPPDPTPAACSAPATPGSPPRAVSPDGPRGARPGVSSPRARRPCARRWPPARSSSCSPRPRRCERHPELTADARRDLGQGRRRAVRDRHAAGPGRGLRAGSAVARRRAGAAARACSSLLVEPNDPGNLGTIIRTADAAGADAVVLDGGVDPYNGKAVRASAGSLFHLPRRGGRRAPLVGAAAAAGPGDAGRRPVGGGRRSRRAGRRRHPGRGRPLWLFGTEAHGLPAPVRSRGRPDRPRPDPRPGREPQPRRGRGGVPVRERPRPAPRVTAHRRRAAASVAQLAQDPGQVGAVGRRSGRRRTARPRRARAARMARPRRHRPSAVSATTRWRAGRAGRAAARPARAPPGRRRPRSSSAARCADARTARSAASTPCRRAARASARACDGRDVPRREGLARQAGAAAGRRPRTPRRAISSLVGAPPE